MQAQALKQQEAHTQLKAYIDDEIRAVHERISGQIRDSQLGLKACVDSLARNIQDLKDAVRCCHISSFSACAQFLVQCRGKHACAVRHHVSQRLDHLLFQWPHVTRPQLCKLEVQEYAARNDHTGPCSFRHSLLK